MKLLANLSGIYHLAFLVAIVTTTGCATTSVDLADTQQLDVQVLDSDTASLTDVEIIEKTDGSAWVRGVVVHGHDDVGTVKGHVHVEVLDNSGKRIEVAEEPYRHRIAGNVGRKVHFAALLANAPPKNAKVIVKLHKANHSDQIQEIIESH